jgi:hypothetical protein
MPPPLPPHAADDYAFAAAGLRLMMMFRYAAVFADATITPCHVADYVDAFIFPCRHFTLILTPLFLHFDIFDAAIFRRERFIFDLR